MRKRCGRVHRQVSMIHRVSSAWAILRAFSFHDTRTSHLVRIAIVGLCQAAMLAQTQGPRPVPTQVWAPKPVATPAYTAPQRPWVKLADVRARHQGQRDWRDVLVDDGRLTGEYVSAAPGTKVGTAVSSRHARVVRGRRGRSAGRDRRPGRRSSPDEDRSSTSRARRSTRSKPSAISPSLRFIVNVAKAKTLYPLDVEPPRGAARA